MTIDIFHIHEFSREFKPKKNNHGKIVSGGYGQEVGPTGPDSADVPDEIKEAVNSDYFRINDSYCPKDKEIALIARELSKYSVLAVATKVPEDGNRPGVAYRYFWLEKNSHEPNFDGIGIILYWWLKKSGKLTFSFYQSDQKPDYKTIIPSAEEFNIYQEKFKDLFQEITYQPFILSSKIIKDELLDKELAQLHALFLYFQDFSLKRDRQDSSISRAWAWNVRDLEHPELFAIIKTTDDRYKSLKEDASKFRRELIRKDSAQPKVNHTSSSNTNSATAVQSHPAKEMDADYLSTKTSSIGNTNEFSSTQFPDTRDGHNDSALHLKKVKKLLHSVAFNKNITQELLKEIVLELDVYPSDKWNWEHIRDNTILNRDNKGSARYKALWYFLNSTEDIINWLIKLQPVQHIELAREAVNTQSQLIDLAVEFERKKASKLLSDLLYQNIWDLLYACFFTQKASKNTVKNLHWLLAESNSIWSEAFNDYAQVFARELVLENCNKDNKFSNAILDLIKKIKVNRNLKEPNLFGLSAIFRSIGNYSLSAVFSQLSKGYVPSSDFEKIDIKILPLKQQDVNAELEEEDDDFFLTSISKVKYLNNKKIIGFFLGTIVTILAYQIPRFFLTSDKSDLFFTDDLASNIILYEHTENERYQKNLAKKLKKLEFELKNASSSNPKQRDLLREESDYTFIQSKFIPTIDLQPEKEKGASEDFSQVSNETSSDNDVNLKVVSQQKDNSLRIQLALQKYSISLGEKTGEIDEETREAIKKVQAEHGIDVSGYVNEETSKLLIQQLNDEYIREVVEQLIQVNSISEHSKFTKTLHGLKGCKEKGDIGFVDCLSKL